MLSLERYHEFALINRLTRNLKKAPNQENRRHQADAELVKQPDGSFLALTVDTLHEEYNMGIIRDPFTVGWSVVSHCLSDLAAVAAEPIGVLLALNLPRTMDSEWSDRFFEGVHAALTEHSTFCLGGDTNFTNEPSFTCTGVGRVAQGRPLTRVGAGADDLFYVTGPLGAGNLLGILRQADPMAWEQAEKIYRPPARLREAHLLRKWMRCAIDTSDALLQAMAILTDLNGIGIDFEHRPELYDPRLPALTKKLNFPLWLVNVFGMGEYELLFAVSRHDEAAFLADTREKGFNVLKIGAATVNPGINLCLDDKVYALDVPYLLNLFGKCQSLDEYLQAIVTYDARLRGKK
jgi:thiamine-monophosphate kinase